MFNIEQVFLGIHYLVLAQDRGLSRTLVEGEAPRDILGNALQALAIA